MVAPSFILMIGDDAALLLPPRGQRPLVARTHEKEDAQEILAALRAAPRAPVFLLADTLAQDYRLEPLPPLGFFDRRKLAQRRLAQAFPERPLRDVLFRKDEALLIAADEESALGAWLDRLELLPCPLKGTLLAPLEASRLLLRLRPETQKGWALFLSRHGTGGFRQVVTKDGQFVFTRLTPPAPPLAAPDYIAQTLAQDLRSTCAYLAREGLGESEKPRLLALVPEVWHAALLEQTEGFLAEALCLTPEKAALSLGFTLPPCDPAFAGEALLASFVRQQKRPLIKLERPARRAAQQEKSFRQAAQIFVAFALALAFLGAAKEAFLLTQDLREQSALQAQTRALEQESAASQAALAREAEPLERLRKAIERKRLFEARRQGPVALWPLLDAALGPEARLDAAAWKDGALSLDIRLKDDGLSGDPSSLPKREIAGRFEEIAADLRAALPDKDVTILRYPFPNLPDEVITNKDKAPREAPPVAGFAIRERKTP